MSSPLITRFAPSPTGSLHLGHAYAAKVAHDFAKQSGGQMVLRIDDIDHTRCRPVYESQIFADLAWLGLDYHPQNGNVPRQSARLAHYQAALDDLRAQNLVYPCFLSRREISEILSAPHQAPGLNPNRQTEYMSSLANTDQMLSAGEVAKRRNAGQEPAWRLRMAAAIDLAMDGKTTEPPHLEWGDYFAGPQTTTPEIFGDLVIARADIAVSYHLCVVVDDAMDQVTLVTRGDDLASSTHLHRLLQKLLGLPTPAYYHHALICDAAGNRLAKRDDARSLATLRAAGKSPLEVFAMMPPSLEPL